MFEITHKTLPAFALLAFTALASPAVLAQAERGSVLLVISNEDFHYGEYYQTRTSLEAHGLEVVVAATTTRAARPQDRDDRSFVRPDLALADASADDYSAVVFIGGWGASQYQYAFNGTYHFRPYRPGPGAIEVNRLISDMSKQDKPIMAVCYGVSVLAWARVDGASPLEGRTVAGWAGGKPGSRMGGTSFPDAEVPMRWDLEQNGALVPTSGSVGDPLTTADDVVVDGHIITAETIDAVDRATPKLAEAVAKG